MRNYLRRICDEGWIIDLSPEGMRPDVATRIFPKVQHPLAVGIFVRAEEDITDEHPALDDLFPVRVPGVKANRAWVFSARPDVLRERWRRLLTESDPEVQSELLKSTRDRTMASRLAALSGGDRLRALTEETDLDPPLRRVLHRSFDRKRLVADPRVVDFPRPNLWRAATYAEQLFLVELHSQVVRTGPGVVVGALLPDQHCFKGSEGGRVLPVYHLDGQPTSGAKLLGVLSERLGIEVSGLGLLCYVAAVVSHPGYTARFAEQ